MMGTTSMSSDDGIVSKTVSKMGARPSAVMRTMAALFTITALMLTTGCADGSDDNHDSNEDNDSSATVFTPSTGNATAIFKRARLTSRGRLKMVVAIMMPCGPHHRYGSRWVTLDTLSRTLRAHRPRQ